MILRSRIHGFRGSGVHRFSMPLGVGLNDTVTTRLTIVNLKNPCTCELREPVNQ